MRRVIARSKSHIVVFAIAAAPNSLQLLQHLTLCNCCNTYLFTIIMLVIYSPTFAEQFGFPSELCHMSVSLTLVTL